MSQIVFQIRPVRSATDLQTTARLFDAYASSLGIDLSYQDFAVELAILPGKYAAPAGELLLARDMTGEPLGCVGLACSPRHASPPEHSHAKTSRHPVLRKIELTTKSWF
jgi:hypothetical protein